MKNRILLIGRLGSDPERKAFESGKQKCTFTLATNEKITNLQGERQEETQWHKIAFWGKRSELAYQYLKKGDLCAIEGKIQYRTYQDSQGLNQFRAEIVGQDLQFLSPNSGQVRPIDVK